MATAPDIEALKRIAEAATQTAWDVSEVKTTDATFMVVGGEGFDFGLLADVTLPCDAAHIAAFDPPTCLALLSELASLRSEREGMREGLKAAAQRFRFYEKLHAAKGTPDADAKAQNNADMAAMLEALLQQGGETHE